MRGTCNCNGYQYEDYGIIPAYAGNMSTHFALLPEQGDHPRVCGEHRMLAWIT